jgi:hypothetical protein
MKSLEIKKIVLTLTIIMSFITLFGLTVAEPPANFNQTNAGSAENPFQIANLANLKWLAETPQFYGSGGNVCDCCFLSPHGGSEPIRFHFIQTADIDAAETKDWVSESGIKGWVSIGDYEWSNLDPRWGFSGFYDGDNYIISNLYMENFLDNFNLLGPNHSPVGLFNYVFHSELKNIRLVDVKINVGATGGSLANVVSHSTITNCSVDNSSDKYATYINFFGYNEDPSDWTRNLRVSSFGGLIYYAHSTTIENCTVFMNINDEPLWSNTVIGGLVARTRGFRYPYWDPDGRIFPVIIRNCNFIGDVNIHEPQFISPFPTPDKGRLIGWVQDYVYIDNCYSTSNTTQGDIGGIVGTVTGANNIINNVFWNSELSTLDDPFKVIAEGNTVSNVQGFSTDMLKDIQTYIAAGFDFETIWDIDPLINDGFPFINLRESAVKEKDEIVRPIYELVAYPNPFNPQTTISFSLQSDSHITLEIFNIRGQKVKTLVNDFRREGNHKVTWDGLDNNKKPVSSGIYFYKIAADNFSATKKMVLMK